MRWIKKSPVDGSCDGAGYTALCKSDRSAKDLTVSLLAALLFMLACEDKTAQSTDEDGQLDMLITSADQSFDEGITELDQAETSLEACVSDRRPIIFVHGFLASGDTWSRQTARLIETGSCLERIGIYDWNSLDMSTDHTIGLDTLIDRLIAETGVEAVDLVGHSAGGGVSYEYLSDPLKASKVSRYVHIGSFVNDFPAGPEAEVPTLNLWSVDDLVVEGGSIEGAENIMLMGLDHYEVATSFESFQQLSSFLYEEPLENDVDVYLNEIDSSAEEESIEVSGRVLTLGENQSNPNVEIEVWRLDDRGKRLSLLEETVSDDEGHFTVSGLERQQRYEFAPLTESEVPRVRYFTPSLSRNLPIYHLRTFPGMSSLAGLIVRQLPQSEELISLVIFNAHRAFTNGRDSLTINGQELINEESANPQNTSIALFVFDVEADGEGGGRLPLFESFPFLAAVDLPLRPDEDESIVIEFNGERVVLPSDPASEGTMVVVFP